MTRAEDLRQQREAQFDAALRAKRSLERKKPLRANPRSKGGRGERGIIDLFKKYGWAGARRNFQSGGQGGGDIIGGPDGCNHEVKHQETTKIWEWVAQSEADARPSDQALVWFRRNKSAWKVCMDAEFACELLRMRDELARREAK